jgi:hypothetical protein
MAAGRLTTGPLFGLILHTPNHGDDRMTPLPHRAGPAWQDAKVRFIRMLPVMNQL